MNLEELRFPPLLSGEVARAGIDAFAQAVAKAGLGCESGLIVHNAGGDRISAALVLAPEVALEDAMAMLFAASLGFSDALGALAPPEVGVHFEWPGRILVNGASCGAFRIAASTRDPQVIPDWLVVGFDLAVNVPEGTEPGHDPTATALFEEGCTEVDPFQLLESWSRHTLLWINAWLEDGMRRLHAEWRGRAADLGKAVTIEIDGESLQGLFVGLDEHGGLLLRQAGETRLIPLSAMLE